MNNERKKPVFSTELAWALGLILTAWGVAFMEKANFGVSMVVAPAYILHLKLVSSLPFFSFGTSEYVLQFAMLCLMCLVIRRFKFSYLLSFVTAVIYGFTLDFCMSLISGLPADTFSQRIPMFIAGMLLCCAGISLIFKTYLPPEVYELFVKEVSTRFNWNIHRFKTCYDIASMTIAIVMSFCFFGLWHFEGIKVGTVICACVNGYIISLCTRLYNRLFVFEDKIPALAKFLKN